jgi:hypothetical protein
MPFYMKNGRIHLIYLAIIGFLAYQYWTKAQALNEAVTSIEQFDKLFKSNTEVVGKTAEMIKNAIDQQVRAYPNERNKSFEGKAKNLISASSIMGNWLAKQRMEFINLAGGEDRDDSTHFSKAVHQSIVR